MAGAIDWRFWTSILVATCVTIWAYVALEDNLEAASAEVSALQLH